MAINIQDKLTSFKTLLGGGAKADEITNSLLQVVADETKKAVAAGLVTKEAGDEAAAASGQDGTETVGENTDPGENWIGDMTVNQFVPFMTALLKTGGAEAAPVTKEMITAAVTEALNAPTAATTKAASDMATLQATIVTMAGQMTAMQATLKELTSDEPRVMRGFIASQSNETIKSVIDLTGPKIDEIDQIAAHVATSWGGQS